MSTEPTTTPRAGRPARITREQILRAGLEIADSEGLESVSMRRLASALKVQAPSLYNHVRTKEEVLDGAADLMMAEVDTSASDRESWLVGLESWARSYRACLIRHPNMVPWFARGAQRGEQSLRNADRVYGGLIRAGWSARDATLIGAATINLVYGSALGSFAAGFPDDPAAYPESARHLANAHRLRAQSARIDRESFELGLGFHLDGLQRLHQRRVTTDQGSGTVPILPTPDTSTHPDDASTAFGPQHLSRRDAHR
jgi:AcrR family transcriptional regulator